MMTDSLRNQLMGLGFRSSAKPATKRDPGQAGPRQRGPGKPQQANARSGKPLRKGGPQAGGRREEIDLGKAYAIRAQREKDERIAAEKARQEEARQRREARVKLAALVEGKALNVVDAEIARHFPYGGKIKRIYVTAEQLVALNAGELGVLQMNGQYLLVGADLLTQAEAVFAPAVALKVDPQAQAESDPYADPRYQVPDDLVW